MNSIQWRLMRLYQRLRIAKYRLFSDCPNIEGRPNIQQPVQFAGKGTIRFDLGRIEQCIPDLLKANQPFTITGGSGAYAGASGGGTVIHDLTQPGEPPSGTDTWGGSLVVPGHTFDLTPPTLSGLVNKTVRARAGVKRVRVKFRVTARDPQNGSVPVRCKPGSGSRFKVGRTVVKCTATDTSANTATGTFKVVVKRGR